MKLVENWRNIPRYASARLTAAVVAIQGAWPLVPDDMKTTLPPHVVQYVSIVLLVAAVVAKYIKQELPDPPP